MIDCTFSTSTRLQLWPRTDLRCQEKGNASHDQLRDADRDTEYLPQMLLRFWNNHRRSQEKPFYNCIQQQSRANYHNPSAYKYDICRSSSSPSSFSHHLLAKWLRKCVGHLLRNLPTINRRIPLSAYFPKKDTFPTPFLQLLFRNSSVPKDDLCRCCWWVWWLPQMCTFIAMERALNGVVVVVYNNSVKELLH